MVVKNALPSLLCLIFIVRESDPVCVTNIDPNGFIGPNDCGLQTDYMAISCIVYYKGIVAPKIKLTKVQEGKTHVINHARDVYSDRISCNYRIQIDMKMDGASFACNVIQTAKTQFKCDTDVVKVHYAKKIHHSPITKVVGDRVICSAKTSMSDVKYMYMYMYLYHWWREDDVDVHLVSASNILEITQPGLYRCKIHYPYMHHRCHFIAMVVTAISESNKTEGFLATTVFVAVGLLISLQLVFYSA